MNTQKSRHSLISLPGRRAGVILVAAAFVVIGVSCNFPTRQRPGPVSIEATFAHIMTEAVGESTSTPTPSTGEIATIPPLPSPADIGTPPPSAATASPGFGNNPPAGKIVFTCFIDKFDEICLMNADGSDVKRLTTTQTTNMFASLAPDGQEIVFSSRRDGPFQIYRMNLDGSDVRRLTQGLGNLYAPAISPDGKEIAFTVETGRTQNIWVMNRDGSNPHALTQT